MNLKIQARQIIPAVVNVKQYSNNTYVLQYTLDSDSYDTVDLTKLDAYAITSINGLIDETQLTKSFDDQGHMVLTWNVMSFSTVQIGHVEYQIMFKDSGGVVWYSLKAIMLVSETIDADDHIVANYPSLLRQWEDWMVGVQDEVYQYLINYSAGVLKQTFTADSGWVEGGIGYKLTLDATNRNLLHVWRENTDGSFEAVVTGVTYANDQIIIEALTPFKGFIMISTLNDHTITAEIQEMYDRAIEAATNAKAWAEEMPADEQKVLPNGHNSSKYWAEALKDRYEGNFPYVTPQMFGAKGDGVSDDSVAFQQMVDSGAYSIRVPQGTYRLENTITISKDVDIDFCNSTIYSTVSPAIIANGQKVAETNAIKYEHLLNNNTIVVANADGFSIGDIIDITCDDKFCTTRTYYTKGGVATLTNIVNNKLVFNLSSFEYDMSTNIKVECYKPIVVKIRNIKYLEVLKPLSSTSYGIHYKHVNQGVIDNVTTNNISYQIVIDHSVGCVVSNCKTGHAKNNEGDSNDGYGVAVLVSTDTTIDNLQGCSGQHHITNGGKFGVTYGLYIKNSNLQSEVWNYAYGCHENILHCVIENCILTGANIAGITTIKNCLFSQNRSDIVRVQSCIGMCLGEIENPCRYIIENCVIDCDNLKYNYGSNIDNQFSQSTVILSGSSHLPIEQTTNRYIQSIIVKNCKNIYFSASIKKDYPVKPAKINSIIFENCDNTALLIYDEVDKLYINNCNFISSASHQKFIQHLGQNSEYEYIHDVIIKNTKLYNAQYNTILLNKCNKVILDNLDIYHDEGINPSITIKSDKCNFNNCDLGGISARGIEQYSTFINEINAYNSNLYFMNAKATLKTNAIKTNIKNCLINGEQYDVITNDGKKYKVTIETTGTPTVTGYKFTEWT